MMARIPHSQTLAVLLRSSSPPQLPATPLLSFRCRSHKSQPHLIEIDLDPDPNPNPDSEVEERCLGRKIEDAIHGIVVRRAAPGWLPFIPGSSYWVPPSRCRPLVELIGKLASTNPLSEEEALSLTTVYGWPSSAFFIEGAPPRPEETRSKKTSKSEDE